MVSYLTGAVKVVTLPVLILTPQTVRILVLRVAIVLQVNVL